MHSWFQHYFFCFFSVSARSLPFSSALRFDRLRTHTQNLDQRCMRRVEKESVQPRTCRGPSAALGLCRGPSAALCLCHALCLCRGPSAGLGLSLTTAARRRLPRLEARPVPVLVRPEARQTGADTLRSRDRLCTHRHQIS